MPAGLNALQTAMDVNQTSGMMARDLNALMERIANFQEFLLGADLQQPPYNMAEADEAIIKSAFTDLDELRAIYHGEATLATAKDFRQFAKSIYGFGI